MKTTPACTPLLQTNPDFSGYPERLTDSIQEQSERVISERTAQCGLSKSVKEEEATLASGEQI
jgi:hypothetical protein